MKKSWKDLIKRGFKETGNFIGIFGFFFLGVNMYNAIKDFFIQSKPTMITITVLGRVSEPIPIDMIMLVLSFLVILLGIGLEWIGDQIVLIPLEDSHSSFTDENQPIKEQSEI